MRNSTCVVNGITSIMKHGHLTLRYPDLNPTEFELGGIIVAPQNIGFSTERAIVEEIIL